MSKERLSKLIQKSTEAYDGTPWYEQIADYLLANGVIVPPCKVGDVVYLIDGVRIYETSIYEIQIASNPPAPIFYTRNAAFNESAIGKSIFLTREEAEAKLKGDKIANQ